MTNRILRGDVISFARHYHGEKFHALLCDPPYSLGFMGKNWDGDIAFQPETWAALAEHLHPGGFGMAFASSRGWHRLAVAIEDAGLRIHPSIFGWVFGSGFPKATRVKDAPEFEGHRYGLQSMKPALEPIIVFQKPYEGKPVESIVETGAGALNIDGARIPTEDGLNGGGYTPRKDGNAWAETKGMNAEGRCADGPFEQPQGRWPANFYVDEEAAARLGEQAGPRKPVGRYTDSRDLQETEKHLFGSHIGKSSRDDRFHGDSSCAARFFFNVNRQIDEADPVMYQAKASRKERDAGLDGMPEKDPGFFAQDEWSRKNMGNTPDEQRKSIRNSHPTVKPIDLTRWLATLLLPPAEYGPRRILVPFSGSGSEMIGAHLAGWEEIVGIEMEREYVEIARARLDYWTTRPKQLVLK